METLACIRARRSIRTFENKPVPREQVFALIDSARFAPSWNNTKAVRFVAIDGPEAIRTIAETHVYPENIHIVRNAPLVLALSIVTGRSGFERDGSYASSYGDGWQMFDTGVACQTLCLAAADLGLGTTILGSFHENALTAYLGIPDSERLMALVAAGYPAETPPTPRRKEVEEILRFMS